MADFNKPTTASLYANFVAELDARLKDMTRMLSSTNTTPTNVPTNAVRWNDGSSKWEKYNGSAWADLTATYGIAISGNAGSVTNGVYTNGSYSDPAWLASIAGSKVSGAIAGNAASATKLATARNINGVAFDGTAAISINVNNSLTFSNAGSGAASGATFDGSAARTVSYNSVGAPSTTGSGASGTWAINISGNAASATSATSASTATAASYAGYLSNSYAHTNGTDGWWRSAGDAGWYNETYAVGIYATEAGNVRTYNGANFIAGGDVTAYSDERFKTNWRGLPDNYLELLAGLKHGIYDRTDSAVQKTQLGVGAQSLQRFLPVAVLTDSQGHLSVNYGATALVSCVKLAEAVVDLRAELLALKAKK